MSETACFQERGSARRPNCSTPLIRERLETAKLYSANNYLKASRVRTALINEKKEVFRRCDVMIVLGSRSAAGLVSSPDVAGSDLREGQEPGEYRRGTTFVGTVACDDDGCGFSSGSPKSPITMQLYARPFGESSIFRVGHAYQLETDWHRQQARVTARSGAGALRWLTS